MLWRQKFGHTGIIPMGTRGAFPGGKGARAWSWTPTSIQYQGQECMELCLHSPSTPSWCGTRL